MSGGALDSLGNFASGIAKGIGDAAQSTWDAAKGLAEAGRQLATEEAAREHAWDAAKRAADAATQYANEVYDDPAKAYRDAKDGANRLYTQFDEARKAAAAEGKAAEFWGTAAGQAAFEIAAALIPVGIASKAGKLAKAAKSLDALDDAADLGKAGARAVDVAKKTRHKPASIAAMGCPYAGRASVMGEAAENAVNFAKSLQGKGAYPGVDDFRAIILKKGDIIIQGDPGPGAFFTTRQELAKAGKSRAKLFQGLQVEAHPEKGYRPGVKVYEVTEDMVAAYGTVAKNAHLGPGGLSQLVLENRSTLKEVETILLGP